MCYTVVLLWQKLIDDIDGLERDRSNSAANALEPPLSCTKPPICAGVIPCRDVRPPRLQDSAQYLNINNINYFLRIIGID